MHNGGLAAAVLGAALLASAAGCEDPEANAAAERQKEIEILKKDILEVGAVQEARARKCVADIETAFRAAAGEKSGALNRKPEAKMGVATAFAVDSESVGKLIEKVKYVRDGVACEAVNEAFFKHYKQGKWPDDARNDQARHKHATETLAKLKEPPPSPPAAIAAYKSHCDKTPHKQYKGFTLNNYACTLQVVWLDASGATLATASGSGKGKPASAPTTLSEKTLQDMDQRAKEVALEGAAAEIAKRQASW